MPKYPTVTVQLTGQDGNGFFITSRVAQALKRAGHAEAADEFLKEALSGDYNHLLQTCMAWVNVK